MYATQSASGQSRTTGIVAVVLLHVALVGALLTMKNPVSAFVEEPPIVVTLLPDIAVPSEPLPLPAAPEEVSLSEPLPQDSFPLPELMPQLPTETVASIPSVPTTVDASAGAPAWMGDVRQSAGLPGRLEKPPYPRQSERLNEEGVSTIEACITPRGTVSSTRLVSSSGFARLDDAAAKWIKQLRNFEPATLNGAAVAECMIVPVEWKIEGR